MRSLSLRLRPGLTPLWRPVAPLGVRARAVHSDGAEKAHDPRWLSITQERLKQCRKRDLSPAQEDECNKLAGRVGSIWLDLIAGPRGFLTAKRWRGLDRHAVCWGDMDSMGHVNNVVYNQYAESARVNWVRGFGQGKYEKSQGEWDNIMNPRGIGLILGSIKTVYKFPLKYPDSVIVLHRLVEKPNRSSSNIVLEAAIYSTKHRRLAATCLEDIVVYDYRKAKRVELKPHMADELAEAYELQEENRAQMKEKIREVELALEAWEKVPIKQVEPAGIPESDSNLNKKAENTQSKEGDQDK